MFFFVLFFGCILLSAAETAAPSTDSYKAIELGEYILSKVSTSALKLYYYDWHGMKEWSYGLYIYMKDNPGYKSLFYYILWENPPTPFFRISADTISSIWNNIQKYDNKSAHIA